MFWNKGRLHWKIANLFYLCHLERLVRPETFGPTLVHKDKITFASSFLYPRLDCDFKSLSLRNIYICIYKCQYIMLKPMKFECKTVSALRGRTPSAVSFIGDFFFACVYFLSSPEGMRLVYCVVSDIRLDISVGSCVEGVQCLVWCFSDRAS